MPLPDAYQVRLDSFCGPLDLLLYLIRQAEVDIHEIPISAITDQYFHFLKEAGEVDFEAAGDFLVMAATLMEIKSRTLMPSQPDDQATGAEGAEVPDLQASDPRYELVRQLLDYQKYRLAAEALQQQREAFVRQYPAQPAIVHPLPDAAEPRMLELDEAHVFDLYEAYERIITSIDFDRLGDHRVQMDNTPVAHYQQELLDRLRGTPDHRFTLQEAFEGHTRVQRIGLFLATLELVRLCRITVSQPQELTGEISLTLSTAEIPQEAV